MFHGAVKFPAGILFLDILALVVFLFTACQGNFQLGITAFSNENSEGDNGQSLFPDLLFQFSEFPVGEQQFAVSLGEMVVNVAEIIFSDVHPFHKKLTLVEIAIGINETGLAGPDGFDLGSRKLNTRHKFIEYLIIMPGFFIFDIDLVHFPDAAELQNKFI
jgi:hypothetical protein